MTEENKNTTSTDPELIQKVAERLHFFFCDANLRQDRFLRSILLGEERSLKPEDSAIQQYPNQCPVEILLRFNTIKKLTEDPNVLVQAAKTLSDELTLSEDEKAIGRTKPFTNDMMNGHIPLTLIVKGLPIDADQNTYSTTVGDVKNLFEVYGKVAMVKFLFEAHSGRKRKAKRTPLGMALVEFENSEGIDASKKAIKIADELDGTEDAASKVDLKIDDAALQILFLEGNESIIAPAFNPPNKGRGSTEGLDEDDQPEEYTVQWKPGCVIQIKGLPEECDREAISEAVAKGLEITSDAVKEQKIYIDYSRGCKDGAIRFNEPSDDIQSIANKLSSGDLLVKDTKVESVTVLEGEDEKKYWENFIDFKNKQIRLRSEERKRKRRKRR